MIKNKILSITISIIASLLAITAVLYILVFCIIHYPELSPENPDINRNMKDYYDAEAVAFVEGEYFEAKLLQCVKLKANDTTYYYYRVVIAPRTTMPLLFLNMFFLPPPELSDYFLVDHPFASNEMMKGSTLDFPSYHPMIAVDTLWPIEYHFTWSNYGDVVQQEVGITEEVFDGLMQTLRIEVHFSGKTETLLLPVDLPFTTITSVDDPLVKNNRVLQAVMEEGVCVGGRNPYRATE